MYLVGAAGRLKLGDAFHAADDGAAVETARQRLPAGQAAELWAGGRIVGRFSRTGSFSAGRGDG
jgi:hypothetical protein